MRSWPTQPVPAVPGASPPVRLHDSVTDQVRPTTPGATATLYVCGITPYDATHVGHAATFVAFDLLVRAWSDGGHEVSYAQNVTDVDDPLLERAYSTGEDWRALADRETETFREDMTSLRVRPPDHYIGAVESIPAIADGIMALRERGVTYALGQDTYLSVGADQRFGQVSGLPRERMQVLFGQRGGDPGRPGKRDPLDPLLWRGARPGEPAWSSDLGTGRPGWHVECTAIATEYLGMPIDVQGGGRDLIFPHHEMCASTAHLAEDCWPLARHYVHAGMVGLDGNKMSKSRGNLVFVRQLRADGWDPAAIRLALLHHHYRTDWQWTHAGLVDAGLRLTRWRQAFSRSRAPAAGPAVAAVRERLADDLNAPAALRAVDRWVGETLAGHGSDPGAPAQVRLGVDALLGVV